MKLRIGVVGAGHWGPNLIRNFSENPSSVVRYICDQEPTRLEALKSHYPPIEVTSSAEKVFNSPDVDAVVLSTPTLTHYALAKKALLSGKHVFVEKPLATSSKEAEEILEIANDKNLELMVGHVFLHNPAFQYLRTAIRSGELGKIYYVYFTRTNLGPIRGDTNAWWDLAPHDVSMMLSLLGELPESVSGRGSSFINLPNEDVVFANFRFKSGIFANIHVSWLDPKKVRQVVVVGSEKMYVFDDMNMEHPISIFCKGVGPDLSRQKVNDTIQLFRKSIFEGQCVTPEIPPGEPLKRECEAFVEQVLNRSDQKAHGQFNLDVVRVLESVELSLRQEGAHEPLSIPHSLKRSLSLDSSNLPA